MVIVTAQEIQKINELYKEYGSCNAVARIVRLSPNTVRKYIADYPFKDESNFIRFNEALPDFNSEAFRANDWGDLGVLSDEEFYELEGVLEEIDNG